MANLPSVRAAAEKILDLGLPIVGLIKNAGIQNPSVATTAEGWDTTFVTNHLGPFARRKDSYRISRTAPAFSFSVRPPKTPNGNLLCERRLRAKKR
jgi:hypothetical protein